MHKKDMYRVWVGLAGATLILLACGLSLGTGSSPSPTPQPFQLPTAILPPTSSPLIPPPPSNPPEPTVAPEPPVQDTVAPPPVQEVAPTEAGTEAGTDVMAQVQNFYGRGFLPYDTGDLEILDDYTRPQLTLNTFGLSPTKKQVQDFAVWADIELKTVGSTTYPNYTGCGFAYRVQNNSDGYTAILTNDYVRMGACGSGFNVCSLFGTTYGFGTGQTNVPNGTKAEFALAVNKTHAWVMVNGAEVGQYTLYTTKMTGGGDLDYAVVTNINAGYSTACKITNVRLWQSHP